MKSPDWIKKGLTAHTELHECLVCPYRSHKERNGLCIEALLKDVLSYIQQLEVERDVAVKELIGTCQVCRWEETEKCASCHFCEDAWNVHESNWEWRGVQKEE